MTALGLDVARIRAITLDLDDTLWPIWPTIQRAEDALSAWLSTHAPRTAALARNPDTRQRAREQVLADRPAQAHDLATIRRETHSWKQTAFATGYLFALAWLAAFVAYRIAVAMGAG